MKQNDLGGEGHGPLDSAELVCLDRLVLQGEMLLMRPGHFFPLETLIKKGYAEIAHDYGRIDRILDQDITIVLVHPTEKGEQIAKWREDQKINSRLNKPTGTTPGLEKE